MDISLPEVVIKELKERAEKAGASVEEYLPDILMRNEDPAESSRKYIEGAEELLKQAGEELSKGNLRQAGEKIWGACALTIKAHALMEKGKKLESHRELWVYKNEVAEELGDWVRIAFKLADSMHRSFYENLATREDIGDSLSEVSRLIQEVRKKITK